MMNSGPGSSNSQTQHQQQRAAQRSQEPAPRVQLQGKATSSNAQAQSNVMSKHAPLRGNSKKTMQTQRLHGDDAAQSINNQIESQQNALSQTAVIGENIGPFRTENSPVHNPSKLGQAQSRPKGFNIRKSNNQAHGTESQTVVPAQQHGGHHKVVTATFNNDWMIHPPQANGEANTMTSSSEIANQQTRPHDGQHPRTQVLSRNQKQNSANTKRIVQHALTSNPYMQAHMGKNKLQFGSPVAGTLAGQTQQHASIAAESSALHNNFPAIGAVRTSHNQGVNASSNSNTSGSNRQNRLLVQNNNQQLMHRTDAPQQFQSASNQGNADNSRIFSGSSQTRTSKPNNNPLNGNLHKNANIAGMGGRTPNAAPQSHQNRSQNDRRAAMDQPAEKIGNDPDALNKYYRNRNSLQSNAENGDAQNGMNNRQSIQSRGAASIRSTKSGKSTHSQKSNNLNRNVNDASRFDKGNQGKPRDSSSPRPALNAQNSVAQQNYNLNQQILTRSAKIKDKVQMIKQQGILHPLRNSKRERNQNLEANYFSDRGGRPASSRLGAPAMDQPGKPRANNLKSSINAQTANQVIQNSSNFKQNMLADGNNAYQLKNNGQDMILNKYLSNTSNKQANQQKPANQLIKPPSNQQHRSISEKSDRIESAKARTNQNRRTLPQNTYDMGQYNYNSVPATGSVGSNDQGDYLNDTNSTDNSLSPNKARSIKEARGGNLGVRGPAGASGAGTIGNSSMSPLSKAAQNQISSTNTDYQYASQNQQVGSTRVQSGKFRNTQIQPQNKSKKSRNAEFGASLVGLNTNKQALFNSNREGSPSTQGNDSYYNNTNATDESPSRRKGATPASARRVPTKDPVPLGNITIQQQANAAMGPGTGETGNQIYNDGSTGEGAPPSERESQSKSKIGNADGAGRKDTPQDNSAAQQASDSRLIQAQQKTLPNKNGEYDQVIQEVERENQHLMLRGRNGQSPVENILDAQLKGLIQAAQQNYNPLKEFEDAKFASKSHGLITSYSANTHQGIQRNYNEDRVSIILNMTRPDDKDPKTWPKCSFFAIYDGHGGSMCADYLKDHLHQIIIGQACFPEDPRTALVDGCRIAEERFLKMAEAMPKFDKSGSCAIIVLTVETECYIANVGDSRAIMSADNGMRVYELSQDHRPNEEAEFYRIQDNGGQVYQTQTFQNVPITNMHGQVTGTQRSMLFGPYRVLPGRLSVSRTFGDIEAKAEKYGGKPGVVISEPEISQFSINDDCHDFIVLGCDGIYDRMNSINVIDASWSAMAQALKQTKGSSIQRKHLHIHQIAGKMADSILKSSAAAGSFDNLTIVMVVFKNLQNFYEQARKKSKQTQAIKIEGEAQPTPHHPRMTVSLASRGPQERKDGSIQDKIQRFNDGVNHGYNTTKVNKAKESSLEADADASAGGRGQAFSKPRPSQSDKILTVEEMTHMALTNFEYFNKLQKGTATLAQVKATAAGVEGWAKWKLNGNSKIEGAKTGDKNYSSVRTGTNSKTGNLFEQKRTSNSTQHDRDQLKKMPKQQQNCYMDSMERKKSSDHALRASQQQNQHTNGPSVQPQVPKSGGLLGTTQTASGKDVGNKYAVRDRESRNKRRAGKVPGGPGTVANDRFGSIFTKDEMARRGVPGMNTQVGFDSHNMTAPLMGLGSASAITGGHQPSMLPSRNHDLDKQSSHPGGQGSFNKQSTTSKDQAIQNAKLQNKLMLENLKNKADQQFNYM